MLFNYYYSHYTYSVQCCSINRATLNGVRIMQIIMKKIDLQS